MSEVATQEKVPEQSQPSIYAPEEINEMFDAVFLPKLQEFARRTKKEMFADKDVVCFQCRMILEFSDLVSPLTYESIQTKVNLQLQPVLQEDLDRAEQERKDADEGKDCGDCNSDA